MLLIRLSTVTEISVGRLGLIRFEPGGYVYAGSALGGLRGRIERHLRQNKKFHWHIDYLLEFAHIDSVLAIETDKRLECDLARMLNRYFEAIPKFGSSGCKCQSHLFYSRNMNELHVRAAEVIDLVGKGLINEDKFPPFLKSRFPAFIRDAV